MRDETIWAVIKHARETYPRECCGLVVDVNGGEIYMPCTNTADNDRHFVMSPEDYCVAEQLGTITMVVHSHPDDLSGPSPTDMRACKATGLPWAIFSYPKIQWWIIQPSDIPAESSSKA